MNLTEAVSIEQVKEEIRVTQEELGLYLDKYERLSRKLEMLVKILNTNKHIEPEFQEDVYLE